MILIIKKHFSNTNNKNELTQALAEKRNLSIISNNKGKISNFNQPIKNINDSSVINLIKTKKSMFDGAEDLEPVSKYESLYEELINESEETLTDNNDIKEVIMNIKKYELNSHLIEYSKKGVEYSNNLIKVGEPLKSGLNYKNLDLELSIESLSKKEEYNLRIKAAKDPNYNNLLMEEIKEYEGVNKLLDFKSRINSDLNKNRRISLRYSDLSPKEENSLVADSGFIDITQNSLIPIYSKPEVSQFSINDENNLRDQSSILEEGQINRILSKLDLNDELKQIILDEISSILTNIINSI